MSIGKTLVSEYANAIKGCQGDRLQKLKDPKRGFFIAKNIYKIVPFFFIYLLYIMRT